MVLDPSQLINNMKRTFNVHLETELTPASINFDEDPYDIEGLDSWYAVRYVGYTSESTGMGDIIDDTGTEGRLHVLTAELSAWCREDQQRLDLGGMIDEIAVICETPSITFYDYADPENPVSIGQLHLKPGTGSFTPPWSSGGSTWKSSGEVHADTRLFGFIFKLDLITVAEVGL